MTFELIEPIENELEICKQVELSPNELVDRFGEPQPTEQHGVSGGFYFEGIDGCVYAVYDAHNTTLSDSSKLLPEQFWESEDPVEFNVACETDGDEEVLDAFIEFLSNE